MTYRYYSTQRPLTPGSCPRAGVQIVDIFCGIVYSLLPMIIDLFFVLAAAISFPSCFMLHPVFPELLKTSL